VMKLPFPDDSDDGALMGAIGADFSVVWGR
jgi:hypothetical protein